jgi:predicted  nucleic acid-binding Zn-ribbon protein
MAPLRQEHLNQLIQMQQLELRLGNLNRALANVDGRVAALDNRLSVLTGAIASKEALVKELQQAYRSRDADVQQIVGRSLKSEEKLRAAKTNKEYQSVLKEIDDLTSKRGAVEDEMLAGLEQIEATEAELRVLRSEYETQQALLSQEKTAILEEASAQRATAASLDTDLRSLVAKLPSDLLAVFNRVKSHQTDGVGIAPVLDAVCQGCHMNIPPQLYNELQREDSLKKCPSCERIIYWQRTDERSE